MSHQKMFCRCPKARRSELLKNGEIPTQSEVKHYLGPDLFKVLCEFSHPNVQKFLGITPELEGTNEDLWISPSDQLLGKVCLKPPLTNKCIKACTHDGILQLGEQAKQKWETETTTKLRNNLENDMKDVRLMFEAEKRHAVNLAIIHTKKLYEVHLDNLTKEHEKKQQYSFTRVLRNANEKVQALRLRERENVTREMMSKFKEEITYIVNHLCEEFDRESRAQKDIMVLEFNRIIRQERATADSRLRAFHQQRSEHLQQLKLELNEELETKKADIIHAERMNIRAQQRSLYQSFRRKIDALEDLLSKAKYVIEMLGKMLKKSHKGSQSSWRKKLCEIVIQFEKFVSMAFEEVPGQAEFIRILKQLVCQKPTKESRSTEENNQEINSGRQNWKTARSFMRKEKFQVVEIIDKHGEKWRPIELLPDVPQLYCTEEQLLSPIVKSDIDICHDDEYINRHSLTPRSIVASDDSLPFVYFEDKLYVRSDYKPDTETAPPEMRKMTELAEDSHFILGLNDPRPCNILIENFKVDPFLSKQNEMEELKQKRSIDSNEFIDVEFQMHVQNLIDAIERADNESSIIGRKSHRHNDDKVVRDLINHLKVVKNSKEIPEQCSSTYMVSKHPTIEETREQSARERVESLIKIFQLHPSLRDIIIQAANSN